MDDENQIRYNFAGGQFPSRLCSSHKKKTELDSFIDPSVALMLNYDVRKDTAEFRELSEKILFKREQVKCENEKLLYLKQLVVKHFENKHIEAGVIKHLDIDSPRHCIKKILDTTVSPNVTTDSTRLSNKSILDSTASPGVITATAEQ